MTLSIDETQIAEDGMSSDLENPEHSDGAFARYPKSFNAAGQHILHFKMTPVMPMQSSAQSSA